MSFLFDLLRKFFGVSKSATYEQFLGARGIIHLTCAINTWQLAHYSRNCFGKKLSFLKKKNIFQMIWTLRHRKVGVTTGKESHACEDFGKERSFYRCYSHTELMEYNLSDRQTKSSLFQDIRIVFKSGNIASCQHAASCKIHLVTIPLAFRNVSSHWLLTQEKWETSFVPAGRGQFREIPWLLSVMQSLTLPFQIPSFHLSKLIP